MGKNTLMSCSSVAPKPRFSPVESLIEGVVGHILDGDMGVVAVGVDITR